MLAHDHVKTRYVGGRVCVTAIWSHLFPYPTCRLSRYARFATVDVSGAPSPTSPLETCLVLRPSQTSS